MRLSGRVQVPLAHFRITSGPKHAIRSQTMLFPLFRCVAALSPTYPIGVNHRKPPSQRLKHIGTLILHSAHQRDDRLPDEYDCDQSKPLNYVMRVNLRGHVVVLALFTLFTSKDPVVSENDNTVDERAEGNNDAMFKLLRGWMLQTTWREQGEKAASTRGGGGGAKGASATTGAKRPTAQIPPAQNNSALLCSRRFSLSIRCTALSPSGRGQRRRTRRSR